MPFGFRLIAPDMRGHGDSDRPSFGYRMRDLADDVVRLMDALSVAEAVVIGHSMGTFVARKVLEAAPDRLSRLVLVAGAPTFDNPVARELETAVRGLTDPVDESFVRDFQTSTVGSPVPEPFMETVIANSRRMPARVWQATMDGLIGFEPDPRRFHIPTLVLGGRLDRVFTVAEQIALARMFPRGELHLVDGAGHALHWEQPETFVSALQRFGV
jgi:pimeloyl-ACP methyl ester carboxylesterase